MNLLFCFTLAFWGMSVVHATSNKEWILKQVQDDSRNETYHYNDNFKHHKTKSQDLARDGKKRASLSTSDKALGTAQLKMSPSCCHPELVSGSILGNKPSLSITSKALSKKEVSTHFASNNPIKKLLFNYIYAAHLLTVTNSTATTQVISSSQCFPAPLAPTQAAQKLSQSRALAPWLLGAGWATMLTAGIGFAIIPSVLFGATLIVAGIIGMNNNHLPASTAHTVKHLLVDGIHDYLIPPFDTTSLIIIMPASAPTLAIACQEQSSAQAQLFTIELKTPHQVLKTKS